MDLRLALMCGIDIPVPECQLIIHQPRIKEIAYIGEQDFFTGVQTFCVDKKMMIQDKGLLESTNNFQIFMTIMSEKETVDKKESVQQLCTILFPDYKIMFTPRSMILSGKGGTITIDENNFEFIQQAIIKICCLRSGPQDQQSFNPANEKAAEIAQKLMRGRQIVASQKGETNTSIFSQYLSTLTVGLHSMSLQDLMDLTMFQLYDLIERYMLYINWDMDIRSRLTVVFAPLLQLFHIVYVQMPIDWQDLVLLLIIDEILKSYLAKNEYNLIILYCPYNPFTP